MPTSKDQKYCLSVPNYTVGFEKLVDHVRPLTPAWAEQETEIPAKDIVRIAHEYSDAAPRAIYYAGRRSSWYREDFHTRRAQAILNAIVGSWDQEGGMVPNGKIALGEYLFLPWDDPAAPRVDEMDKNFPLAAKGDGAYLKLRENVIAGTPYPVKAWMVHKQDPLNALPNQARTLEMVKQMDFIGVIDVQMSDTAWYADVIFPESTCLERTDPVEVLSGRTREARRTRRISRTASTITSSSKLTTFATTIGGPDLGGTSVHPRI